MKKNLCFVVSIIILSLFSFGIEIEIIKDPKPTCFEKNVQYEPLKKYKEISNEDDESETFIALARSVTADRSGNIFLFDGVFCEIFKYDKNLVFQGRFGGKGKGPGEFATHRGSGGVNLNISGKNRLYAQDYKNRRITVFSLKGDYIIDYKTEYKFTFNPAQDIDGNLYIPSENGGVIDIFNSKMELTGVLLDVKEFRSFLFYEPVPAFKIVYSSPYWRNFRYDLLDGNRLLVYIRNSSTIYLLENRKLKKKLNIWPEKIIKGYKAELFELYQKNDDAFINFSVNFFIDGDDNNFFYIQFGEDRARKIVPVYKFDLNGDLQKIFYIKRTGGSITIFQCKRNNTFYTIKEGSLVLYK
ncbi:MAG: hypothetical protein KAW12_10620 [Candidatus Aminicenantes bacterium]|nr:hypothetical protein [Candidatus Aminicenantes bacterium]